MLSCFTLGDVNRGAEEASPPVEPCWPRRGRRARVQGSGDPAGRDGCGRVSAGAGARSRVMAHSQVFERSGVAVHRSGVAVHPSGVAVHPSGVAVHQDEQDDHPGGGDREGQGRDDVLHGRLRSSELAGEGAQVHVAAGAGASRGRGAHDSGRPRHVRRWTGGCGAVRRQRSGALTRGPATTRRIAISHSDHLRMSSRQPSGARISLADNVIGGFRAVGNCTS